MEAVEELEEELVELHSGFTMSYHSGTSVEQSDLQ